MAREPDPRVELAELEKSLARGALAPGYVLRGPERYFRAQALERIERAAREARFELCPHQGRDKELDVPALLDDLCGGALFAAGRCVVIGSPEPLLKKDGPVARAILSFLEGRRGTVVLEADSLRSDLFVVKQLVAAGGAMLSFRKLYETPPPYDRDPDPLRAELVSWVVARARELGVKLSAEQALLLVAAKGNELHALEGELEVLRAGGVSESLARVERDVAAAPFRVAEDMVRGDVARALPGIETLFRGGMQKDGKRETSAAALLAILFSALRKTLRQALAGALELEAGADLERASAAAGVPGYPAAQQAFRAILAGRTAGALARMTGELALLERRTRSTSEVDANDLALLAARWGRRARVAGEIAR